MFASAFKSITSPINSGYTVSSTPTATAGPWKIYDAKKKSTNRACSVFVLDRKSLSEAPNSSAFSGRSSASSDSLKRAVTDVVDRLRREAQSLARLRHPSVLELVEPVEDTRGGGLQFATESVTASLAGLLLEKDEAERSGGRGRGGVTDEATRRRRELDIDELEIQKGLLQVSKALEFLHDNAGLVHGNITPDAILINSKGDWKISGLSFCGPPGDSSKATSFQPIALSEVLDPDPRLPRSVQLNLDYTSPDFVLDNNVNTFADMFSLGVLAIALYNSPHESPIKAHGSLSGYKRLFNSSSTVPSASNGFLASKPLPRDICQHVLPRLITRRPAGRMTAKEFQNSEYFNNIFVSTIRFLDTFPAKTPSEKATFMRGLNKVLPQFPKSVMEKKVLPALLEELKDKELLSLIMQNVFKIVDLLPSGAKVFGDTVRPTIKAIFVTSVKPVQAGQEREKDAQRDAGLMVVLEHLPLISRNCSGKEFKDDILPILFATMDSSTPAVLDAALRCLPTVLPMLDFSTIKNELFPVVAQVFSKTTSLAIKVRGLNAFIVLCGGSPDANDGMDGMGAEARKATSSSALDKYTMQEKIVPLIRAIKTKEPAVMMAALNVLRIVGQTADAEFVAMDILPILWSMSLGSLLNLKQFQAFMDLIKILSRRVEDEQTKKLQELSGAPDPSTPAPNEDFLGFGGVTGTTFDQANGVNEDDFERLVRGNAAAGSSSSGVVTSGWDNAPSAVPSRSKTSTPSAPVFSWSTPSPGHNQTQFAAPSQQPSFRTVTPDLGRIEVMSPSSTQFSQPLQPTPSQSFSSTQPAPTPSTVDWSSATANPWSTAAAPRAASPPTNNNNNSNAFSNLTLGQAAQARPALGSQLSSSFSLPPPQANRSTASGLSGSGGFSLPPPPGGQTQSNPWASSTSSGPGQSPAAGLASMVPRQPALNSGMNMSMNNMSMNMGMGAGTGMSMSSMSTGTSTGMGMSMNGAGMSMGMGQPAQNQPKSGLDKYESLL